MNVEVRRDELGGLFSVTLSVEGRAGEVEAEGETLAEAFYNLAEQLELEASR